MAQTTSNPCSISQWAAVAALEGPQAFLLERAQVFTQRRDLVVGALNAVEGITCAVPDGAFYVYPDCGDLIGRTSNGGHKLSNDNDIAQALLGEALVAVVPGAAFHSSPHIRISYATNTQSLKSACIRIATFCHELR